MHSPLEARSQAGAFLRSQARAAGIANDTIRRRVSAEEWVLVARDVVVPRQRVTNDHTRAWAAHLATGGVVSHHTAAAVHRLGPRDESSLHVISDVRRRRAVPGVTQHRIKLGDDEVVDLDGLPLTSRRRTVVDLLGVLPISAARGLLFRSVQQGWVTESDVRAEVVRRRGMTGNVQLRSLATLLGTGAHSYAERVLHDIVRAIPGVEWKANVGLATADGRFVADVLLPGSGVVIEVDGRRFHSSTDQFVADRRRQNAIVGAGYVVLRFTWRDLVERPQHVRRTIERTIVVTRSR